MNLIAIVPVRNEDWIIGCSLRAMLRWVDWAVVLNHASTDNTAQILDDISHEMKRISICTLEDPVWNEMDHRQYLLTIARQQGATHIAYVDADEILTGNLLPCIRQWIEPLPQGVMLSLPWLQLRGGLNRVHYGGVWGTQSASAAFRDVKEAHWAARDGYHFHQRHPLGVSWQYHEPIHRYVRNGGLMHLQMADERRLRAKQALYVVQERLRWPDRQMPNYAATVYGYPQDTEFRTTPWEWWEPYENLMQYIKLDAEPWQESMVKALVAEHGREKFAGLDLFGVIE